MKRGLSRRSTAKTKAIVPVHYAGVGCAMEKISAIAASRRIPIVEDAAQAVGSSYQGRALGSFGSLAALSFHETKNIISGEGGALLVNDPELKERAEIIWEKGTNRKQFYRGQVDKYSWVDLGSSYLPGEIIAAFLWAQMENERAITKKRLLVWARYHAGFENLEKNGKLRRPIIPADCGHNAHMYYLLLPDLETRTRLIKFLKESGILSVFHYVPLDSSPMGKKLGRASGDLKVTHDLSDRLLRLPLWVGMDQEVDYVIEKVKSFVEQQV
jgi:dTDP-4-amino-4,6-dideoxygalactose transaminase